MTAPDGFRHHSLETMSNLKLPEPKSPLQARAFALLRALLDRGELSRPQLVEINGGNGPDTRRAILFLRDNCYIFISGSTAEGNQPLYKAGNQPDVNVPRAANTPKNFKPQLDPMSAALFGRPVPV